MSQLGQQIDAIHALRETKRGLESQLKDIEKQMQEAEVGIMQAMDAEGIKKTTSGKATVSITESVKPQVEDWDAFGAYIIKNKFIHLLERRPSVTGCRELFETKGSIPGVVPFTKRSLNIRSVD